MNPEDLLKLLRENGLKDEDIKGLLKGVLDSLDESLGEEERLEKEKVEKHEKEEAGKLLGVTL